MPRYRFTGFFETVLHGLAHGVNAELHRAGDDGEPVEHEQPPESTVVVQPGDEVETDQPYPHPQLVNLDTGEPDEPPGDTDDSDDSDDLADGLAAVEAAGQGASEALATLRAAAAGAEQAAAASGQHAAESSEPPATEVADPDNPPAASPATDESQE